MSHPRLSQSERAAQLETWADRSTGQADRLEALAAEPGWTDSAREGVAVHVDRLRRQAASESAIAAAHRAGGAS